MEKVISKEVLSESDNKSNDAEKSAINDAEKAIDKQDDLDAEFLEMIGEDTSTTTSDIHVDDGIKKWWKQWMTQGIKEGDQKDILKKYPTEGKFYAKAPKVNLEIERHMTDISKKRDQHFSNTQDCTGAGLIALGAAISLGMGDMNEPIDYTQMMRYLWDAGKLFSSVFFQESKARKSFITPILDKELKTTLENTTADEWLYGSKLTDQVKEAKTIVKAASILKPPEKQAIKKLVTTSSYQGNWRGPPTTPKWHQSVGTQNQKRQFTNFGYRQKTTTLKPQHKTNKEPKHFNPTFKK